MVNTAINRWYYKRQRRLLKGLPPVEYPQLEESDKVIDSAQIVLVSIALAGVLFIGGCITAKPVHAEVIPSLSGYSDIPSELAIKAIIGEAENQGYQGMLAVACALRNRGTLKGVYGLNAPRVRKHLYSESTYQIASNAWFKSSTVDVTNGATHWENIKAFGCPKWVKRCVETFRYKDHVFYKEMRA